jgi:PAS domain S-box-containing protein
MDRKKSNEWAGDTIRVANDFELITLRMRWLAIGTLFLCYPPDMPRVYLAYALALTAALYNLTRYSSVFMRSKWYSSTLAMLVVDNIFIAALIALVGDAETPFTGFMVWTIITAGYSYKLRGTLIVVAVQMLWVFTVLSHSAFVPVHLTDIQAGIATAAVLIGTGIYIERLTRMASREKSSLEKLSHELEAGRKHLLTLVNSLNDAIFVVDDHGRVTNYNAAAEYLCEYSGDMLTQSFAKVLPLRPHVTPDSKLVNLLKTSGPQHRRDLSVIDKNGAITDLDISVQPVLLEGKKTTDYIIVCKDITKERSVEEQRSEFISVASHELRTPITIMEAALSAALLSKDKMDEQTRTVLEQAHTHCLFLASIVKDLSMLAEASNDNLPIQLVRVNPADLLKQMSKDFEAQAKQKGLKIKVETQTDVPVVLSTENHIREILQNYITNAIKYSTEGAITLRAKPSNRNGVIFSVQDTGIGISPSDQKHLFTKFFRSEDYRTRSTGGTGLGLYLCKEIAQRLNGKIWCESELNKGSTFYLEIPPVSHLGRDQGEVVKAEVANLVEGI